MRIDEKVAEATKAAKESLTLDEQFDRNKAFVEEMQRAGVIRKVDYNIPLMTPHSAFTAPKKFL